jgi:ACR3 family arsenite transporter
MIVIVAMFASQGGVLFANPEVVLLMIPPVLAFFVLAFVIALVVGQLFRLTYEEVALLVFTTTARNSEASLAVAATAFASPLVALTVVIGPGLELPMLIIMARVLLWLHSHDLYPKQAPPQPALGSEDFRH